MSIRVGGVFIQTVYTDTECVIPAVQYQEGYVCILPANAQMLSLYKVLNYLWTPKAILEIW